LQLPALKRIGMLPRWSFDWRDTGVRRILKLWAPAVLGVSVSQVSLLINTIFASFLGTGSVSWLYYADRLMEFPSGMLGAALGTILLPSLARYHAGERFDEYSRLLDWGLRMTLLLAAPAALALAIIAAPLIATLFHHGAFTAEDVLKTRHALVAYSVGLPGLILVKVLAPAFYARQDVRTPVKIGIATALATQAFNLALVVPLRHAGLALSISLAACLNAGLLYRGLRRQGIYAPQPGWPAFFVRLAAALAAMGAALWFVGGDSGAWLEWHTGERLARLALVVGCGAGVYFATLWLAGFRLRDFQRRTAEQHEEERS
jgi:putative peptidoglycan lipid II flippase